MRVVFCQLAFQVFSMISETEEQRHGVESDKINLS